MANTRLTRVSLICPFVRLSVRYGGGWLDGNKKFAYLIWPLKKKRLIRVKARVLATLAGTRLSRSALFRKRNLRVIIAASNIPTRDKPFTWLIEAGISRAYGTLLLLRASDCRVIYTGWPARTALLFEPCCKVRIVRYFRPVRKI